MPDASFEEWFAKLQAFASGEADKDFARWLYDQRYSAWGAYIAILRRLNHGT